MKIKNIYEEKPRETKLETAERWSCALALALGLTINEYTGGGILGAAILCGGTTLIPYSIFWCIKKNRSFEE
jgi:hypothetical protein